MARKTSKKRVYIESSVISYLTARPPRDIVRLARQQITREWWEQRTRYALYISQTVLDEIIDGDAEAVRPRLRAVEDIPALATTVEVDALADHLLRVGAVPAKAKMDAYHIATASIHKTDYLVSWNQKHIVNAVRMDDLRKAVRERGETMPLIVKPGDLLEGDDDL